MDGRTKLYNLLLGNTSGPMQSLPYSTIGRDFGASSSNSGSDDNFFTKRAKSLENAFDTTVASIISGIDSARESAKADAFSDNNANKLDEIARKYGFSDRGAYWDALSAAEESGNNDELQRLDSTVGAEMRGQTSAAAKEADKAAKDWQDYRENSYVGQKINQDRGKFLGSAINTLSTGFDVMAPGAGILANSVQGGIEGIADELEQNGLKNFDLERAGQNALIGATTGAVTGGLNKGVNNMLAKNGGNLVMGTGKIATGINKFYNNTIPGQIAMGAGRGALSGAVGGATGAGLSAAMNGQDVLGSAIQGAQQGYRQGALAGGIMAGAGLAKNSIKNAINGQPEVENATRQMSMIETEPQDKVNMAVETEDSGLYPAFEPGDKRIQQRNKLQSMGEQLQNAAKTQKYGALYDSLDNKTAARAVQTGAPDKLSSLGVKPENYLESAKTSDYINDLVTRLADNSDVKTMVPDMTDRLSLDNMDILMSDNAAKKYNSYIKQIVADGSTPDEYSAGYLLQKSREFGKKAANLRGNTDDVYALRQALTDAKYTLRDLAAESLANAEITSDLTNEQIAKGLAKLGANKQIQDYYTETVDGKAPNVRDYIARSALFEQARDMGNQIEAEKYTRSASKAPANPLTRLYAASGLEQPMNTVLKNTVAPVASGITKLAGKAIEGAGNIGANIKNVITSGDTPIPANNTPVDTTNAIDTAYNPATRVYEVIGRNEGLTNAEQARTANYLTNAVQDTNATQSGSTLESLVPSSNTTSSTGLYNSMYGEQQSSGGSVGGVESYFQPTGDYWTDILGIAMTNSIKDGDYASFGSLYEMYKDALSNVQKQSQSSTKQTKLTGTQQRANAAMDSLERLSQMTPDLGYNLSGIPVIGNIATLGGNDYEGEAKSLAQQIGYMVSGANIKEEEAYNIGKAYVPQPFDSEQTRNLKLQRAYNIIRQYQNGVAEEA